MRNPMFMSLGDNVVLHYGTDPLLGFPPSHHLRATGTNVAFGSIICRADPFGGCG